MVPTSKRQPPLSLTRRRDAEPPADAPATVRVLRLLATARRPHLSIELLPRRRPAILLIRLDPRRAGCANNGMSTPKKFMTHRISARRRASWLLVIPLVALFVVGTADAKLATPLPGHPPIQPKPSTVDSSNRQHVAALELLMNQFGLSRAQATDSLELQSRAADDLQQKLADRLGDGFTDVYFDNQSIRYVVALSPSGDDARARSVAADLGLGDIGVERRNYTRAEMMADLRSKADRYRDDPSVRVALTEKGVEVQGGFNPDRAVGARRVTCGPHRV